MAREDKLSIGLSRRLTRRRSQAYLLTREVLSGTRRDVEELASVDDDSMENIDSYWQLANRELNAIKNEPLSSGAQAGEEKRTDDVSRKSFDEEFERELDSAQLSGFSDSTDPGGECAEASSSDPSLVEDARMEPPPDRPKRTRRPPLKHWMNEQYRLSFDGGAFVVSEVVAPEEKLPGRARRNAGGKAAEEKASQECSIFRSATGSVGICSTRHAATTNGIFLSGSSLECRSISIPSGRRRKLPALHLFYVVKGSLAVDWPEQVGKGENTQKHAYEYRYGKKTYKCLLYKTSGVFVSATPLCVYNPGKGDAEVFAVSSRSS